MRELSHLDARGRARMVDVGGKDETERVARAEAHIVMAPATLAMIQDGAAPKGDVIAVARLAGIMAAKRTHELIPLCHQLSLTSVAVDIEPDGELPACAWSLKHACAGARASRWRHWSPRPWRRLPSTTCARLSIAAWR